jgi:hypothetical protein
MLCLETIVINTIYTVFFFSFDCFLKKIVLEPISSISRNRKTVLFISNHQCRSVNILNDFLVGCMFVNVVHSRLYDTDDHQQFFLCFFSIKKDVPVNSVMHLYDVNMSVNRKPFHMTSIFLITVYNNNYSMHVCFFRLTCSIFYFLKYLMINNKYKKMN